MKKKQQLKIGFPFPILSFYDFKIINISPSFFIYFILFIYFGGGYSETCNCGNISEKFSSKRGNIS